MDRDKYDKLVRDKVPNIIRKQGRQPIVRVARDDSEYIDYLAKKLVEEACEYNSTRSLEELVDILEVIQSLLQCKNYQLNDLDELKEKKKLERGGFTDRIILEFVINSK